MGGMQVKKDAIALTRGDTAVLTVTFSADGEPYTIQSGDAGYLTVKKNVRDEDALLEIEGNISADHTEMRFEFAHAATQEMEIGTYKYDIQLNMADGRVCTVAGPDDFVLLPDVTTER